ncbi:MAG: T9SS type A sorting domain-containing protein [Sphingobacteriia bacterium]|nr:T9SS type A sorting domain-containing protein [Sphingobacteriia bacterium]
MKKFYLHFIMVLTIGLLMNTGVVQSQSNQYLHFDKVDDFVILENGSQYFSGTDQLTITGWFWCDALAYGQGYMGFRLGSGDAEFYMIQLNNGVMECRLVTTTGLHEYVAPANTAIPQVWQHFAWVYNVSTITLYVNGAVVGSAAASGTFEGTNAPFAIGKSTLGGYNFVYGGRVDEVSAWNKALTQEEIEDIMDNELTGAEEGLQLYYKFNQGEPGGNNTAITHLICEIGNGERNAELMNFALTGETSNFNGTLNPGYQAISFPQIPNHLTIDPPFEIEATATSGLEVLFEVLSGPATIAGNLVTLTGEPGEVIIRATQPGNSQYDPADPVINNFMVLDPASFVPEIDARHPLEGDVFVSTLSPIRLTVYSTIDYPELFWVQGVEFMVNGEIIPANDPLNTGYFTGWWTPPAYGNYTITIHAANNYGAIATQNININIVSPVSNIEVVAAENIWINPGNVTQVVDAELPSFLGAFDQIIATLEVTCPPGGCGEYDRLAWIDAKSLDGEWFEIIRYITPYSVACSHQIDLTDYMSLLQGKVSFRFNCETLDNGYLYKLTLNYRQGTPDYLYSTIVNVWDATYQFGDYANLQPVEEWSFEFPDNAETARLKLVSTGHGWGDLNTGNAAEFYNATHHILVNGTQTFTQVNWNVCNPNPDGCQPQNGTWYHNRAGWCPGSIAQWFDFDMTPFISIGNVTLKYIFYEEYVDLCHPNHPDCVSGVTCDDCDDGFNPHLVVACNLVIYDDNYFVGIKEPEVPSVFKISPNPTNGRIDITGSGKTSGEASIQLMSLTGTVLNHFNWNGLETHLDLSAHPKGIYFLMIQTDDATEVKKLILQ